MCMQNLITIFHSVQEIGLFSLFFRIWRSAKPRPMINVILQPLGLDVVNINAYAKFYQNIPHGLELSTFFTNSPVTKSSQTVRWQNQMFDYRAHYESQPSVSGDFLRVVQYNAVRKKLSETNLNFQRVVHYMPNFLKTRIPFLSPEVPFV